jgi:hypothetical protein
LRFVGTLLQALAAAVAVLFTVDLGVRAWFPSLPRFDDNFSAAYLRRSLVPANIDGRIVFAGDSALWGYKLSPQDAAVTRLRAGGMPVVNLSYEGGSAPNTYALLKLMFAAGAKPRAVVFNVNSKEFNEADSAYRTLYPAVEQLAWPLLSAGDRALLHPTQPDTIDARIDRFLGRYWTLYGMRVDVREQLFGAVDAATALQTFQHQLSGETQREADAHRPTPDRFLGTYDLSPLDESNVGVVFLKRTLALLRAQHVAGYAILTPTNHALLHDYIDVPEYRHNLDFLTKIATRGGARVLDYDRAFATSDFIDNDHLTAAGNVKLAAMLRRDLRTDP